METDTIISNAVRCGQAYTRGLHRGQWDAADNCYNEYPLSGEFAGESVSDLLGDLIDAAADEWESQWEIADGDSVGAGYWFALSQYVGDVTDELCEHYEHGYMAAFSDREFCDVCSGLVSDRHAVRDNDTVYCSLSCSGDLG